MRFYAFGATLLLPFCLSAQVDTGAIAGVVSDNTGAVVPGVKIVITHEATNLQTILKTNDSGFYAAPALRLGRYSISATMEGFRGETKTGIELRVQERLEINFQLEVGATTSEITVTAAAPLLESETSSLGQVVEERTITDLPLNGRNFIQLATLGAGTLPSTRTAERDNFVSNGARAIQNSYLLDGVENKNRILGFDKGSAQIIQPVIDAIQEFKVQTSTFSAEFGQSAGGVVNVTLKSGTNDLHGSLFEFLRNSKLDARPYFQPEGGGKPAFIQNQFGGTLGGRIRRDRAFYFASWQRTREINAAPQVASVPIQTLREGNFGNTRIFDPATVRPNPSGSGWARDQFPANRVPAARWDPVSAKLAPLYPQQNLPGNVRNYFYNPKERVYNDQLNGRVDYRIGSRDTLFGRLSTSKNENALPAPMPDPASDTSIATPTSQSVAVSETRTLTNAMVNEFRFAFVRTRMLQETEAPRRFEEFGIKGALNDPKIGGLPTFPISGLTTLGTTGPGTLPIAASGGTNIPIDKWGRVFQFLDNVSWVRGRHTVKFGGDIQQVTMFASATLSARPAFNFNGVYTQNPQGRSGTGAAFADFLLGLPNNTNVSTRSISKIRDRIAQGYIQDDWKVSKSLTVNLGLRYELTKPFVEVDDQQANFVLESGPYYAKLVQARERGPSGLGRALVDGDYNNFAPRLGLAWQAAARTVVRSGFGVFYGRDENIGVNRRLTNNPPFFIRSQFLSDQINPIIVLSQGIPSNALDPTRVVNPEVISFPRNFRTSYTLQWNLNVQQELPGKIVAQVGYTGSGARKLYFVNNVNIPPPGPGNVETRRPIPGVGGVFYYAPVVSSSYNALLAKAERRFSNGYSLLASYTWGHSIDNGASNNDQNDPGPQNPRDLRSHRGNSNFDVAHRFVVSNVWELPFGKGKRFWADNAVLDAIAGGWQLAGITSMQTGQPFTVQLNYDPSNTGGSARPNRLRDGSLSKEQRDPARWFDLTAFEAATAYTFGNSGRNILRAPGRINVDLGVARSFSLGERLRIQFRGEFFNLANTPQFGLPGATIGAAGVGIIGSVITPERQVQFALRLAF